MLHPEVGVTMCPLCTVPIRVSGIIWPLDDASPYHPSLVWWADVLLGDETRLSRSAVKYQNPGKFIQIFNDTISREENKTIFSGLRITGVAFFGKSFYLPRMTNPGRCVIESNLFRVTKGRIPQARNINDRHPENQLAKF